MLALLLTSGSVLVGTVAILAAILRRQARTTWRRIRHHNKRAAAVTSLCPTFPGQPGKRPLHVALVGDSLNAGVGASRKEETPSWLLGSALVTVWDGPVHVTNLARPDSGSADLPHQVTSLLKLCNPDVVLLVSGANDVARPFSHRRASRSLRAAVNELGDATVIVGTCPDFRLVVALPQPLRWVLGCLSRQLVRHQLRAIRQAGAVAFRLDQVASPQIAADPEMYLSADDFHPSGAGYALVVDELVKVITPLLTAGSGLTKRS
ncbi:SGNH/GDSL hydrolase family protein [Streptomyces nanshensis]|uniref:SGNH/GDSL hydrolase family protein n=1 Tax=Streptomyces nanshensis TaxID=518642 RepID=UPI00085CCF9E|nr:SGNH/GDSL hydrolase family protein [Streptomyces nanshensis]